ncbi:enamine deaminase RidA (YjgF/YER057c/UK114 family) [Paraburkholderia sp. GAS333]|uniref:RidA family protein n=1 Tax=Paraburkholderia sp. GAS333 TaxID=3156279 RepID=UPI003D22E9E4
MSADEKLDSLTKGYEGASTPAANYQNATRWGNLMFLSGKSSRRAVEGKLGSDIDLSEGRRIAREVALELLLVLREELGSLSCIGQFIELQGFINASEDFKGHAQVLDGASDLLVEILGPVGVHSRSVFGAVSLRGGQPVILRAVVGINS